MFVHQTDANNISNISQRKAFRPFALALFSAVLLHLSSPVLARVTPSATSAVATASDATAQTQADTADDAEVTAALAVPGVKIPGLSIGANGAITPTQTAKSQTTTPAPTAAEVAESKAARAAQIEAASLGVQALPELDQPVVDAANLLSASEREQLTAKIRAINDAKRAQIGVIIVPTTGMEPIFDYATRAATTWQLGNQERDNGVLIVVAVIDRKVQILTGHGIEGLLPDILAKHVIEQNIKPYFKAKQYATGLNAGIDRIDQYLQADPDTIKASELELKNGGGTSLNPTEDNFGKVIFLLIALLAAGAFARMIFGRFLSASGLGVTGGAIALISGAGLLPSLLFGGLTFLLLLIGVGNLLSLFMNGGGGGFGGSSGGGNSGYSGGGGSFGGGGASGSW